MRGVVSGRVSGRGCAVADPVTKLVGDVNYWVSPLVVCKAVWVKVTEW